MPKSSFNFLYQLLINENICQTAGPNYLTIYFNFKIISSLLLLLCHSVFSCLMSGCLLRSSIILFSLSLSWLFTSVLGCTSGWCVSVSAHARLSNQDKLTAFTPKWPLSCFLFTKLGIQILSLSLPQQFTGFHRSLVNWFLNYLFKK